MFKQFGEPTVATTSIAFKMGVSPGNLYYQYHTKEQIVEDLFAEFRREIEKREIERLWPRRRSARRTPRTAGSTCTSCSRRSQNIGLSIGTSTISSPAIT
jgi:AcrR family transcriptional regulator